MTAVCQTHVPRGASKVLQAVVGFVVSMGGLRGACIKEGNHMVKTDGEVSRLSSHTHLPISLEHHPRRRTHSGGVL